MSIDRTTPRLPFALRPLFFGLLFLAGLLAVTQLSACKDGETSIFQGYVEGEFVYVAPSLAGHLDQLAVERGDLIAAGDQLFVLENGREQDAYDQAQAQLARAEALLADKRKGLRQTELDQIQAELDKARASLSLTRRELNRRKALYADETITKEEFERVQTEYKVLAATVRELEARLATAELPARDDVLVAAQAEYEAALAGREQARWSLDQKTVTAPESGMVFDTLYTPGEFVPMGAPVVVLLPPHRTKVRFFVQEAVAGALSLGQQVLVSWDGGPSQVQGTISYISPQVEYTPPIIYSQDFRHKLVIMIEAGFDEQTASGLHPGQPVDVTVPGLQPQGKEPGA